MAGRSRYPRLNLMPPPFEYYPESGGDPKIFCLARRTNHSGGPKDYTDLTPSSSKAFALWSVSAARHWRKCSLNSTQLARPAPRRMRRVTGSAGKATNGISTPVRSACRGCTVGQTLGNGCDNGCDNAQRPSMHP